MMTRTHVLMFAVGTFLLVFGLAGASCSDAAKEAAKTGAGIVVDCTKGAAPQAVKELTPMVEKVVLDAIDTTGKVDWSPVKELGKSFSLEVGGCVLAEAIGRVLSPKPADPSAPKSADLVVDAPAVRAGFEQTKRELFGQGVTFQTSAGDL